MAKSNSVSFEHGMISFARSLQISEGVFTATHSQDEAHRQPIPVREKGVRGQSSEDNAKNPGLSNPQSVEFAVVPEGCDIVELSFNLRVLPHVMKPHACGDAAVNTAYQRLAAHYAGLGGFTTLARLYVWNLANARFAWRNRFQADEMQVNVLFDDTVLSFDPLQLSLEEPNDVSALKKALIHGSGADLDAFLSRFAKALSEGAFSFSVIWRAQMQPGQEIFPSQEFLREERRARDLSRVYAKLPIKHSGEHLMQASMHSQKIGAAIRHIDIWHGDENHGPVAVNPYAGDQSSGAVLRNPRTKRSFYDLRRNGDSLLASVESASSINDVPDDVHFVMANLLRGGVFGASSKKKEAAE